ncbi:MAG: hypothetical protein LBP32_06145, partial [Spirochaetaceae bacterium]|nr:hypothetical protein [Spirochaetaceae bacterium]
MTVFLFFPWLLPADQNRVQETARRNELIRVLGERGIPFEVRPLHAEYGGFGASVHINIPAAREGEQAGTLIVAVPLSGETGAPPGLPYHCEAALAFAEKVLDRGLDRDLSIAFLGDESSRLPGDLRRGTNLGLRNLAALVENPESAGLLYLDILEAPGGLLIHHGSGDFLAPLNILRPLIKTCQTRGIPYTFAAPVNERYKLGLEYGPPVLALALGEGFPALYLTGLGGGSPISPEGLGETFFDYAESLDLSGTHADTHYSIFPLPGGTVFIPELATVGLFLGFSGVFLLIILINPVFFRSISIIRRRIFTRQLWMLPLFWGTLLISLYGAALFFSRLLGAFAVPVPRVSYGGLALYYTLALILFFLAAHVFVPIKISRRANFYGNAALLLAAAGIFVS